MRDCSVAPLQVQVHPLLATAALHRARDSIKVVRERNEDEITGPIPEAIEKTKNEETEIMLMHLPKHKADYSTQTTPQGQTRVMFRERKKSAQSVNLVGKHLHSHSWICSLNLLNCKHPSEVPEDQILAAEVDLAAFHHGVDAVDKGCR